MNSLSSKSIVSAMSKHGKRLEAKARRKCDGPPAPVFPPLCSLESFVRRAGACAGRAARPTHQAWESLYPHLTNTRLRGKQISSPEGASHQIQIIHFKSDTCSTPWWVSILCGVLVSCIVQQAELTFVPAWRLRLCVPILIYRARNGKLFPWV